MGFGWGGVFPQKIPPKEVWFVMFKWISKFIYYKVGPLPVTSGVITPIQRVITPILQPGKPWKIKVVCCDLYFFGYVPGFFKNPVFEFLVWHSRVYLLVKSGDEFKSLFKSLSVHPSPIQPIFWHCHRAQCVGIQTQATLPSHALRHHWCTYSTMGQPFAKTRTINPTYYS